MDTTKSKIIKDFISILTIKNKPFEGAILIPLNKCVCDEQLFLELFQTLVKHAKKEEAIEFLKLAITELEMFGRFDEVFKIIPKISGLDKVELEDVLKGSFCGRKVLSEKFCKKLILKISKSFLSKF